MERSLI